MKHPAERARVVSTAQEMLARGFTEGTSGNVSMRVSDGALITPTTMPYPEITPDDVVLLDLDGNVLEGNRMQSIEFQVHLAAYRRRENVGGVIHSHPVVASAFSAARVPLPAFLEEFGVFVGDEVRVAEFGISGTPELAEQVADALGEHNAAFIASHGLVCVGRDPEQALLVTSRVERACLTYVYAKMLGGPAEIPGHARDLYSQVFTFMQQQST